MARAAIDNVIGLQGSERSRASTPDATLYALVSAIAEEVAAKVKFEIASHVQHLAVRVQPALLNVKEAAVYLGRSEQSVQHLIFEKDLPVVRVGRRVHLDRRDLDTWIEKMGLSSGLTQDLTNRVTAIDWELGQPPEACSGLGAFMQKVIDQAGGAKPGLMVAQAEGIVATGNDVETSLSCSDAATPKAKAEQDVLAAIGTLNGMKLGKGVPGPLRRTIRDVGKRLLGVLGPAPRLRPTGRYRPWESESSSPRMPARPTPPSGHFRPARAPESSLPAECRRPCAGRAHTDRRPGGHGPPGSTTPPHSGRWSPAGPRWTAAPRGPPPKEPAYLRRAERPSHLVHSRQSTPKAPRPFRRQPGLPAERSVLRRPIGGPRPRWFRCGSQDPAMPNELRPNEWQRVEPKCSAP